MRQIGFLLLLCFFMISIAGCAGYRFGTLLPADIKTVYVPTFKNTTGEPLLEVSATNAVINKLNTDGTLKVVSSRDGADSVLEVTIVSYTRNPVRYTGDTNPNEFRLTVGVSATFTNLRTGKPFLENRRITGDTVYVLRGSLSTSERAAFPAVFNKLGDNIVKAVVEGWPDDSQNR